MDELSEEYISAHCPHCDSAAEALTYLLEETDNFRIVCGVHPVTEGHILIIPKSHLSCIGEYPEDVYKEFLTLYQKVSDYLLKEYGSVSSFEHGKFGQTVFHSHIHLLPFKGDLEAIIPEGKEKVTSINNLSELKRIFKKHSGYLFFSIGGDKWVVDVSLIVPRFFRDRFAKELGKPERGNWKEMHLRENGNSEPELEVKRVAAKWKKDNEK
ncbi:HIT domain-containing protein [Patescibacteria group bacterium]|nr:HIT domain-containing protein [Patescibacteria group bacterium]